MLKGFLNLALSSGTHKLYQRASGTFTALTQQFFFHSDKLELPISMPSLSLFISYFHARKLAYSTIKSYLSAISYVQKLKGLRDPTQAFLINKLLTALSRKGSCDICLPILRPVVHELVCSLGHTASSALQRTFFFCCVSTRILWLLSDRAASTQEREFGQKEIVYMIKITISKFNHNTTSPPFDIFIERELSSPFFPVQALINYCKNRGNHPGPFFCHSSVSPITVS